MVNPNLNQPTTNQVQAKPKAKRKPAKQWVLTQKKASPKLFAHNERVEADYHKVIAAVKQLMQPGDVYFERDYKKDKESDTEYMHLFQSTTVYWHLECSKVFDYKITYTMQACPFEAQFKKLLKDYSLEAPTYHVTLANTLENIYGILQERNDKKYFHTI